jgi:hypothetical protein
LVRITEKGYLNKHLCSGSALLPLSFAEDFRFTDYYFFDKNQKNIDDLTRRIKTRQPTLPSSINIHTPKALAFDISSQQIFVEEQNRDSISLVIIDPEDIGSVRWN